MRGIDNVVGRQAVVQPARGFGIADGFLDRDGESDHVVADFGFKFVDAGDVNAGAFAQGSSGGARDDAGFGESFCGCEFDFQPFLKAVLFAPDMTHFGSGIARNQIEAPIGKFRYTQ